jgi:hypothetical protein
MTNNIKEIPKEIKGLADDVIFNKHNTDPTINSWIAGYEIEDWDLDRVYLMVGKEEYTIRMWNITDTYIRWTLFIDVPDEDGGSHGEEVIEGLYILKH